MKAMALPYGSAIFLGIFLVGLLLDHEENRRKSQIKLNASEKRYRELFESLVDVVYRTDRQGNIEVMSLSAETVFGYHPEEVEGKPMADFYRDPARRQQFVENLRCDGYIENFEAEIRKKNGSSVWVSTNAKMLTDASGAFSGVEGVARDISKIKKAEEDKFVLEKQLRQSQKMEAIGTLAGGVAHDFNNMLGAIMGYAELTLSEMDATHPLRQNVRQILEAARRSADLTRQLLGFARKQTIDPVVFDLNETVGRTLNMLRRLIGENIDLAWLPGATSCKVKMDPSQLDQVLTNLCVNARDAIPGVGKVTIETGLASFDEAYCVSHAGFIPGEFVLLAVSDNGCGMDKETLDHIFEPFFTTKAKGQGTGLGLAMVYGIVKQNEGFINTYSEPGQGTTFKIYLARHDPEARTVDTAAAKDHQGSQGETILIVEDDRILLEMGTMMLQRLGYTVLSAGTPSDALRLARETSTDIHLFLTDVVMPEMNGRDLADRLQKIRPTIKHLFMSGYTSNVIAHQSVLDVGVNFIHKPFSLKDLAAKLREVLDG
ncbi:MAG: PAS domain S-box protein [Desulfobacteraceae bacterium]|nr:PAS domain S-box protein [Desulfobacteraceae bacterium]